MTYPRMRWLVALVLATGTMPLLGQVPVGGPFESREPPLADEYDIAQVKGRFDPDEPSRIERAEHVVPTAPPRVLPGNLVEGPTVIPAAGTQVITTPGELPTPLVTLDVEGSDVATSGQPVLYKLVVKNVSKAKAHNVTVRVTPPKNAERIQWLPQPTHDEAEARWVYKMLEPGQTRTIELSYMPKKDADEIKIQARVQFDFGRGMITKVSAPSLKVKKEGPETVVVGDVVTYRITVTNDGKVAVKDIEVKELLQKAMVHDTREVARGTVDGRLTSSIDSKSGEQMWTIPQLAAGQSKVIEYRVKAREAGRAGSVVLVKAGSIEKQVDFDAEVMTANLAIQAEGPSAEKGTVGQKAKYTINVTNTGSADLRNVAVRAVFPPDMRVVSATNGAQPFRDSVQWIFPELKHGGSKELVLYLTTSTPGSRTIQFSVKADKGTEQKTSAKTTFAGVSSVGWDTDVPATAGVGKTMTYRVTVSNTGTAEARNTQLHVDLPPNVDVLNTAPDSSRGTGQNAKMVIFTPFGIPAGKKTTFVIEVRARSAGEARVVFQLSGEGVGSQPVEHRKTTNITGSDPRSPAGPAPAARIDPTTIGALPPK